MVETDYPPPTMRVLDADRREEFIPQAEPARRPGRLGGLFVSSAGQRNVVLEAWEKRRAEIVRSKGPRYRRGLSEFPHLILHQARVHEFYLDVIRNAPSRLEPDFAPITGSRSLPHRRRRTGRRERPIGPSVTDRLERLDPSRIKGVRLVRWTRPSQYEPGSGAIRYLRPERGGSPIACKVRALALGRLVRRRSAGRLGHGRRLRKFRATRSRSAC